MDPESGLVTSGMFDEEVEQNIGKQQWEDFMQMQQNERKQPEMHEEMKTLCMKFFPKLANKTNLTAEELQTYYSIRFNYITMYNEKIQSHEKSLSHLALALLRAGKIKYSFTKSDPNQLLLDSRRAAAPSSAS